MQGSMGFARAGDGVGKHSSDYLSGDAPDERLCWHIGSDGWRCGTNYTWLSDSEAVVIDSTEWERIVYVR